MRRPLVLEPERSTVLNTVVEQACREAGHRRMFSGLSIQEAKMIIAGRVIRAMEAGESDVEKLRCLALMPGGDRAAA
jgi:hypothetical protein